MRSPSVCSRLLSRSDHHCRPPWFTQPVSFLCRHNEELIEKLSVPKKDAQPLHFDSEYPQGYVSQFNQCLWKFWLSYWRDAPCESGNTSSFDPPHSTCCAAVSADVRHYN